MRNQELLSFQSQIADNWMQNLHQKFKNTCHWEEAKSTLGRIDLTYSYAASGVICLCCTYKRNWNLRKGGKLSIDSQIIILWCGTDQVTDYNSSAAPPSSFAVNVCSSSTRCIFLKTMT